MASISSKVLFITTSPRTPAKMIPEIELLYTHFSGKKWNNKTQIAFMALLKERDFYNGVGANDPAFSARDRINRSPKSLGFVLLSPNIKLTPAGEELIKAKRKEEIFLRQLLKFQLPSPYHKPTGKAADFWTKPYLELFRLIRHFGNLKFDELRLFGLQLVDYRKFDVITTKITKFRTEKALNAGDYKGFYKKCLHQELKTIYEDRIQSGETKTRETSDASLPKFLKTQASNLRDYADAAIRYLRATGLVNISHVGKSISIVPEKTGEVDYFLKNTERDPCFVNNEKRYIDYLGDSKLPVLLTDDKDLLVQNMSKEFPKIEVDTTRDVSELKDVFASALEERKANIISANIKEIKDYRLYSEINMKFNQILDRSLYDAPLMLEWNTWRAMTMLDGGKIKANLKFDDFGNPMSTAQGNMADIVCDYGDFGLTVEVTLQSGQRQYEMEGEPVARHLAKFKREINKDGYCLFVAPKINDACIAHFYALHNMNISYYGGTSTIVPLPLSVFIKMVEDSYKADYVPKAQHIKRFFESSKNIAVNANDEKEWYDKVISNALGWLTL